jgi:hypothetical protein
VKAMICEYLDTCAFMEHIGTADPLTAHAVRMTYCGDNKEGCARYGLYQVFEADDLPDYLWPNDDEDALEMIRNRPQNKAAG